MKTLILTIATIIFSLNIATANNAPIDTLKNNQGKEIYIIDKNNESVKIRSNFFEGCGTYHYKTFVKLYLADNKKSLKELLNVK